MRSLLLLAVLPAVAWGQTPQLVEDLTPPAPGNAFPRGLVKVGSQVLFFATTHAEGEELWVTDGTDAGTHLLREVRPGRGNGTVGRNQAVANDHLFFQANDGLRGSSVWVSDGTASGTVPLLDFLPGRAAGRATFLGASATHAWFDTDTVGGGFALWRSDGTPQGTLAISSPIPFPRPGLNGLVVGEDLYFTPASQATMFRVTPSGVSTQLNSTSVVSASSPAAALGSTVFFSGTGTGGDELWKTDGTLASTMLVRDVNPSGGSTPRGMTAFGGFVYFSAQDQAGNAELWRSDGSSAGTTQVRDIEPGSGGSYPFNFTPFAGRLYFTATTTAAGNELWRTDGTTTTQVRDVLLGTQGSYPDLLAATATQLFFSAEEAPGQRHLFRIDTAGTVTRVRPDLVLAAGVDVLVDGARLYFPATDGVSGFELWVTDGTAAGTTLVKNIEPDVGHTGSRAAVSTPTGLRFTVGTVYEEADSTGVRPLLDLQRSPAALLSLGSRELFVTDSSSETRLYVTDGTDAGTRLLTPSDIDRNPGLTPWRDGGVVRNMGALYFSDGAGLQRVSPVGLTVWAPARRVGESLAVVATEVSAGSTRELWATDGTYAGTVKLSDLAHHFPTVNVTTMVTVGARLFFFAYDADDQGWLWVTDGTVAGTTEVARLFVDPNRAFGLVAAEHEGSLYFVGREPDQTRLWVSDGTESGTRPLFAVSDGVTWLFSAGHALLFDGSRPDVGTELFVAYPEASAPLLVADLEPGPRSSSPAAPTLHAGRAYFTAFTQAVGEELYALSLDTTPPTVTPMLAGTLGLHDFYTSDVTVTFDVADPESVATLCAPAMVSSDTVGEVFSCTAVSMGGSTSAMVTVKRDATAPVVTCPGMLSVPAGSLLSPSALALDALDPAPMVTFTPPAGTTLTTGTTHVTATAVDQAGNSATCTYDVQVTAPETACTRTSQCDMGLVCLDGTCQSPPRGGCGCTTFGTESLLGLGLWLGLRGRRRRAC